ncbi:MAG: transglycosylase domain-containing protein [Bryobacterales bacterium]|nr:transglycosylase domain-containing protein [Bryobacterales bacterium]
MLAKLRDALPFAWARAGNGSEWSVEVEEARSKGRNWKKPVLIAAFAALGVALAAAEMRTSWLQARLFTLVLKGASYKVQTGESAHGFPTSKGPYDERLGYARLNALIAKAKQAGFEVEAQARWSEKLREIVSLGMFPLYQEKTQAGLRILGRNGRPLHSTIYPELAYEDFESIPPLVVRSALFIENREILDGWATRRNPAIEWDRLAKAFFDLGIRQVNHSHPISGGSTLATQLEKIRHSPGGRTEGVREKARQIASASLRAYLDGPRTIESRRLIVRDYLNSVPLAATAAEGEVIGLADGLKNWYGADFGEVNRLLKADEATLSGVEMRKRAVAYRQVLSLLLAINRPTYYLRHHPEALRERADSYIRVMGTSGLISKRLRDLALHAGAPLRPAGEARVRAVDLQRKGTDSVRYNLLGLLGVPSLYELDRMDLTVETTLEGAASQLAAETMERLDDPAFLQKEGLVGEHLLAPGQGSPVIYSLTMYERGAHRNRLLLQLDNSKQALNLNEGSRLELGSTAKLRTLATYLELVSELHDQLVNGKPGNRTAIEEDPDKLTQWAKDYLANGGDRSLGAMLNAAMERKYSASPGEAFFTGGGLHVFANFDKNDNGRILTVREAFQRSVNLVFIRLMRDVVSYQIHRLPGYSPTIFSDESNPLRKQYLIRFADKEGAVFLKDFYDQYEGQTPDEALETLLKEREITAPRFSVIYRSVRPEATFGEFQLALLSYVHENLTDKRQQDLYDMFAPGKMDWNDRGYVASIHPLEMWLVYYMQKHPNPSWEEVQRVSAELRQDVYKWLFKSRAKLGQDSRIKTVLEADAFGVLHKYWKRQGYPFRTLVPSLATAIGSSGDTPAALAELAGIILNDGVRLPDTRIERLLLAQGTPFETRLARKPGAPVRIFSHEVAQQLHKEMRGVVEFGTGRRAFGSVKLADGVVLPVAGKTGTGDNRIKTLTTVGKARNRTAAFVFTIGDRYYGTLLAYVPGEQAAAYKFSSALPVSIFKLIVPDVVKVLESGKARTPTAIAANSPVPPEGNPAAPAGSLSR